MKARIPGCEPGTARAARALQDASYDEAYANPGKLHAAGVKDRFNSSASRTLPYEAAQAVPYGLPHEAALEAVTRNAADMLGFGARPGKRVIS